MLLPEIDEKGCKALAGRYFYKHSTGRLIPLNCGRRECPNCGKAWAYNIQDMLDANELVYKDDKALTLTSAYDPGYKKFWLALKLFWRNVRSIIITKLDKRTGEILARKRNKTTGKEIWLNISTRKHKGDWFELIRPYQKLEYFGVVEYNQKHTQPHFHFILRSKFIPHALIRSCWMRAQGAAGFEKIAFDTRIEKIQTSVKRYFTKYITDKTGGKDEIPRPENWNGRGIRYSREFYSLPPAAMRAGNKLRGKFAREDFEPLYPVVSRTASINEQVDYAGEIENQYLVFSARPWIPAFDYLRSTLATRSPYGVLEPYDPLMYN